MEPPDIHHLRAAQGWLELGNPAEARAELDSISPSGADRAEVLEVRWEVCCKERLWEDAATVSQRLIDSYPALPSGWIGRSYSLHEMKRTQAALDCLLPVVKKFPAVSVIPYNLACYCCQLTRLDEAREWFERAVKVGDKTEIVRMGSKDPDLRPLWTWIESL